jgi:adenosylhomocysteinase
MNSPEFLYIADFRFCCDDDDVTEVIESTLGRLRAAAGIGGPRHAEREGADCWLIPVADGATARLSAGRPARRRAHPDGTYGLSLAISAPAELPAERLDVLAKALEAVPFTRVELAKLAHELPLLSGLPEILPAKVFRDTALMIMGHFMSDLVTQVEVALSLGARPEALTIINKGYPYKLSSRVAEHLRRLGIRLFHSSQVVEAAESHAHIAQRHRCARVIAVDDGGYVLPALLNARPDLVPAYHGLVEQTMSGIYRLEKYGDNIPLPVFSVAESRLKGTIESYWIAEAAIANVLRLLPGEKLEGRPALVIGYGQIGADVARILRQRRMRVACHDRELLRLVSAHENGFVTAETVGQLLAEHRPYLIVGSTGRTCLGRPEFAALRRDCILVSVTSRTVEFDLPALVDLAGSAHDLGVAGVRYRLPGGVQVTTLADGYPVNFHHAESVPNRQSDLIMAGLLVGAAALADPAHRFTPGHNVALSDTILQDSGLLHRFYRLYGPAADQPATETGTP